MQQFQKQNLQQKNLNNTDKVGQIKINYYTDPLCCWSWAFEIHWQKLLAEYGGQISHNYVMGGLIPHWKNYNDPINSVTRPIQMGPVWMHASEVTQTKMKYSIWHEDPPSSSYPACIAVKTVGLQSQAAAEKYLQLIRKALMEDGQNISKPEILLSVAKTLESELFNFSTFQKDWDQGNGKEAFRNDLQKTKFHSIGRFPTLTFQNPASNKGIIIVGYRPYNILKQAFDTINASSLEQQPS
ncbi:DsbA family protein [Chryseolinea sp. H1M3-3]|uniref:DsbA family protein n=1 Tax=Chryseolinea sp. H1M3-3 TaxID=3034144 RepID=UPI0023EC787B|nr:DsbA family protein [Chryseolinea sp. H1M3-3]